MTEKLLLVDDEEGIRNVLGLSLRDAGYVVVTASCVDEALELFTLERPDIILSDIKMPGQSGLDLLRRVKEIDRDVEVIMLTGHGDVDLAIESLKLDATDFLTKPINDDVLEFALTRAKERIAMRNEIRSYAKNLETMVEEKSAKLVEAERQLAALQVVDGLSFGVRDLAYALDSHASLEGDGVTNYSDGTFNEMPCFVAVHGNDMRIASVNELYRERLGNLIGERSWCIYAPSSGNEQTCPVRQVLDTGHGHRSRRTIIDKCGHEISVIVHASPIYDNDGDVELVLELSVDVSGVTKLREELRRTRERYRQLFDESPSYVAVIDKDMRIVEANKRFRDDFGEPENRACYALYMHRSAPCGECPAKRTFADGLAHQYETVVTAKDGRSVNVLVVTVPLRDANGNIAEVMEMSADITELRSLQDHLAQLGLLLGSTAHGVKGLLTALDGSVYRIGSGLERNIPERVEDGFKDIRMLVGKLRKMMLAILYYSKHRELDKENISVLPFVDEIAGMMATKATELGVEFTVDIGGDKPSMADALGYFEVDSSSVSAALVNIIENALEACAGNPAPPAEGSKVTFNIRANNEFVYFLIQDNGPGMDRETSEKLFTLFFSSKGSSGTGIGLFVASQMVKQHGGNISVESTPGKGAAFRISLPRRGEGNVLA